ncbi:MAG: beta-lactamase family protein [Lentisphaeria bacterium]|nr:beta-lactamase family protein [Lentisphaeria bacterium]
MYNWELISRQAQAVLDNACRSGRECGCQFAIYYQGKAVLDTAAGTTLPGGRGDKVTSNTLFPLFSCGKALLATAVLQSLAKGVFDLNTPLAEFWQEFGTPDKKRITVEHILSHRAGMYILPRLNSDDDLADWELMCRKTAEIIPRSAPGKKCVYHPLTFAWLAGNLLVLTEKKPLSQIIRERILKPCGIENEFFFGLDDESDKKFAPVDDTEMLQKPSWYAEKIGNRKIRHSCIPSFNACGSARALARFYAALKGELPQVELLPQEILELATRKEWRDEEDIIPDSAWNHFGLGLVLSGPVYKRTRFFGHGGAIGGEGFYDRDTGIAVGFAKNRPLPSHPMHPVRNQLSELLNIPIRNW